MIKKKFSNQINIGHKSQSLKTNNIISIFLKNKQTSPSISISSKNSEIFKLNPNKTDYKNSKIILRQKSLLDPSKTNPNFFMNKLKNPIPIQKKQSYNLYKSNPLMNKFKKGNFILNSKNDDIFTNNSNYNDRNYETEINQKLRYIPLIPKKKDEFEISEEDKMFDQFLLKKKKNPKKSKTKAKIKLKSKKKKLNFFSSYEAPLNKVYKRIPFILNKIELTKKLKNSFSLLKYQNLLLDVSKNLDWDSRVKLTNIFTNLRNKTSKEYELLRKSVREIENKEKKIIEKVNKQQDYFKKNMREKNYYCMTIGMSFHGIPSLKFHRTATKLRYKQMGIL